MGFPWHLIAKRIFARLPGMARTVGISMIAAAIIALAIPSEGLAFKSAIMLVVAGFIAWLAGAASEATENEVSP